MDEQHRSRELFSRNLTAKRIEKGLTNAKASAGIGITSSFLFSLEKGKKEPSFETLDKICAFYKIFPYELFL